MGKGEKPRDLGRGKDADEVWVSLLLAAITEISLVAFFCPEGPGA